MLDKVSPPLSTQLAENTCISENKEGKHFFNQRISCNFAPELQISPIEVDAQIRNIMSNLFNFKTKQTNGKF